MHLDPKKAPLYFFLLLCFFVGGPLQFVGIISPTQTNYIALAAALAYLVSSGIEVPSRSEFLLLVLMLFVVAGISYNNTSTTGALVYIYYLVCPAIAVRVARMATKRQALGPPSRIYRLLLMTLSIQVAAVVFQNIFGDQLITIAAGDISRTDVTSGTFFVKSDGSLAIFCTITSVLLLSSPLQRRWKIAAVTLAAIAIYLSGSKAAQAYFPLAIAATLFYRMTANSRYRIPIRALAALFALIAIVAVGTKAQESYAAFMDNLLATYDYRYGDNQAQRFAPLGDMLFSPTSYLGSGALHYYDPLTGNWLYYAGFSLIYSFYYDFGLAGLVLIAAYVLGVLREASESWAVALFAFAAFLAFSITAFSLTDLSFFFFLVFACIHHKSFRQGLITRGSRLE